MKHAASSLFRRELGLNRRENRRFVWEAEGVDTMRASMRRKVSRFICIGVKDPRETNTHSNTELYFL